jgi:hypothetical protein
MKAKLLQSASFQNGDTLAADSIVDDEPVRWPKWVGRNAAE